MKIKIFRRGATKSSQYVLVPKKIAKKMDIINDDYIDIDINGDNNNIIIKKVKE